MKARLCVGIYATNSYYFEGLGIEVFCMEELAYCLRENAFLLETDIMNDRLLHFIGTECRIPDLAKKLYPMVHQKGALSEFVTTILNFVGFFDAGDVGTVEETVRKSSGLMDYEKKKLQIDSLLEKKKYSVAIDAYNGLIESMENAGIYDSGKRDFVAQLYYNIGVAYANMLLYNLAAVSFLKSYEWKNDSHVLRSYLLARRLELPAQEYISLVAKHPEYYEESMKVEQRMQTLEEQWMDSPECMGLENMRRWRMTGDKQRYYAECEQVISSMQEEYRNYL